MEDIRYLWLRSSVLAKLFKTQHYDHTLLEQVSRQHIAGTTTIGSSALGNLFGPGITALSRLWSCGGTRQVTTAVYTKDLVVLAKNYVAEGAPLEPAYHRVCTVEWRTSGHHVVEFMGHSLAQLNNRSDITAENLTVPWRAGMHSEESAARYAKVFMALPVMAGEIYKVINQCDIK